MKHFEARAINNRPDQLIISVNSQGTFLQSYGKLIVAKTPDGTKLDRIYWNYSRTTGKYRNIFLNEKIEETKQKINSGVYQLTDLN